jgi:hypothetical protein
MFLIIKSLKKCMCILQRTKKLGYSISIATGYEMDGRGSIPSRGRRFYIPHKVHTTSGAHPASYPTGSGGSFPRGKVAGA